MLYLDKDALDKAKTNYSTYAQDMKTLKTKLESAVDDIRSGWKSDAGDAFLKSLMTNGKRILMTILMLLITCQAICK